MTKSNGTLGDSGCNYIEIIFDSLIFDFVY